MNKNTHSKLGYLHDNFKVFHLKDTKLTNVPVHYHDFHKILVFLNGKSQYMLEGKTYNLAHRDIVLVRAGEIHQPLPTPNISYERIVIYIAPRFLLNYGNQEVRLDACFYQKELHSVLHLNEHNSHDLLYHLEKLEKTARKNDFANDLYTEILFIEFIILLNRALLASELSKIKPCVYDEKVATIIDYINNHLAEDLTIDALAKISYTSKFHLMRKFKELTGYSIYRYIMDKRLLKAKNLLLKDLPITKIALDTGFSDYSSFSRAFKKFFKISPTAYRKQLSENVIN